MDNTQEIRTRRAEYADATRAALLAAAREIFTREGYQNVAVETISRAARVTRGAFYHHFPDKKMLFEALVVTLQAEAATTIRARAGEQQDAEGQLLAGVTAFLECCMEPAYRRLVIQEGPSVLGSARCREIGEEYPFGLLIASLDALKGKGRFDVENVYLAGRMIGNMICEAALLIEDTEHSAERKQQAIAIIERVLGAFMIKKPRVSKIEA